MTDAGATLHERIVAAALTGLAGLLPVLIVLAHRGVAPVLLVMGLAVASRGEIWRVGVPYFLQHPDFSKPLVRAALFFAAFALWAGLSGVWAPRADAPRLVLIILAPALAGGAVIWEIARRRPIALDHFSRFAAAAFAAAIVLVFFEAMTNGFLRSITPPMDQSADRFQDMISIGRGATIVAILIVPGLSLLYLHRRSRLLVGVLAAAALIAAFKLEIFANVVGMLLAVFAFAAVMVSPARALAATAGVVVAALVLAPLAALIPVDNAIAELSGRFPVSWLQRLAIWRLAAEEAIRCLPLGCGADYARSIYAAGHMIVLPGAPAPLSAMPVHPHSLFLQIWLELGLPGVALFAAAIVSGAQAVIAASLSRAEKAAIAATVAVIFVSALVEFSMWQMWRVATPLFAGVLIALAHQARAADRVK